MVESGAKHLIYLSRSAGQSKDDQSFMRELQSQGLSTQCFAGDVADPLAVQNVVKNAARPVSGVIQISMVLKINLLFSVDLNYQLIPLGPGFPSCDPQ